MDVNEIYIAIYDLTFSNEQVLDFKQGDRFIPLSSKHQNQSWVMVIDLLGNSGFIPLSYVRCHQVSKKELIDLLEGVLETLNTQCASAFSSKQRQVIQELTNKRSALLGSESSEASKNVHLSPKISKTKENPKEVSETKVHEFMHNGDSSEATGNQCCDSNDKAYKQSTCSERFNDLLHLQEVFDKSVQTSIDTLNLQECKPDCADVACMTSPYVPACNDVSYPKHTKVDIPVWLVPSLIENVRHETQLSHENSKVAVAVMLRSLRDAIPDLNDVWIQMKDNLDKFEVIQEKVDCVIESEDKRKLLHIFKQLWYCKNDEQQRSWPVHEDETVIASLLEELNTILTDADPRISREILQRDDYEMVDLLATYYQMEPRRVLRLKMLYVFYALCELDITVIHHLLYSVLPMEFARDMMCTPEDTHKLQVTSFMLSIIFSTGQKPPNGIYEFINKKFLDFLFEQFEIFTRNDDDETGNQVLTVILAFNLHFHEVGENLVLQVLKERHDARLLSERLIFLLNREDDPTKILKHKKQTPNSVLKILVDIFSKPELVQLFYLNDIKVLLGIVDRQLTDYFPGEEKRMWYLQLARNIIRNSNFEEHKHRQQGLQNCFNTVLTQELPCPEESSIVKEILEEFPCWFSAPAV